MTASFTAADNSWTVTGTGSHTATIAAGGVVTFSYPTGNRHHNADFAAGPAPSSCTQTAGPSSGPVPPLPAAGTSPGWSGTCTFSAAGSYTFFCDVHPDMVGTVEVVAPAPPGTTATTTTATQPVVTTAPSEPVPGPVPDPVALPPIPIPTTGAGTAAPEPAAGPALTLSAAVHQRGTRVRGIATLAQPGRLTVTLRSRGGPAGRRVGRQVSAGAHRFTVTLTKAARRNLQRRGRLTVTLTVTVQGSAASVQRTAVVTLSAAR
jgi:plastocyanin